MTNIVIIGECYGEHEAIQKRPFVGPSGYELTRMLNEAGIDRQACFLTNVINQRPPGNRIESFCDSRENGISGYPALVKGLYLRAEFAPELERLAGELIRENPNLIIALGNTALWAMCGKVGISKLRGTTLLSTHTITGYKILCAYHPAAVLRQWELRPTTVIDLIKAAREAKYPELRRPQREIWIEPTLADMELFYDTHLARSGEVAVDIETAGEHITSISFAPNPQVALVIPFLGRSRKGRNYYVDHTSELAAWGFVRRVLGSRSSRKVFQNGLFDIAFLWRAYGIPTYNAVDDTMLLHHSLQPESLKSLAYLGSIYTDESSWKQLKKHSATIKRDS
jgi:uracil-DNA glycosylase